MCCCYLKCCTHLSNPPSFSERLLPLLHGGVCSREYGIHSCIARTLTPTSSTLSIALIPFITGILLTKCAIDLRNLILLYVLCIHVHWLRHCLAALYLISVALSLTGLHSSHSMMMGSNDSFVMAKSKMHQLDYREYAAGSSTSKAPQVTTGAEGGIIEQRHLEIGQR